MTNFCPHASLQKNRLASSRISKRLHPENPTLARRLPSMITADALPLMRPADRRRIAPVGPLRCAFAQQTAGRNGISLTEPTAHNPLTVIFPKTIHTRSRQCCPLRTIPQKASPNRVCPLQAPTPRRYFASASAAQSLPESPDQPRNASRWPP